MPWGKLCWRCFMQSDGLFSFILEFDGGTYIKQINAIDLRKALQIWVKTFAIPDFLISEVERGELILKLLEDDEIKIAGVSNIWFYSFLIRNIFGTVHIVKLYTINP